MQGNLANKSRRSLFVFEMFGTMFLTLLYRTFLQESMGAGPLPFFFVFWMITMMTARISGAHYNPAVTFVCMFKRDNEENFPKSLGFVYILAQFIGAFAGAMLSYFLLGNGGSLNILPGYVFQAIVLETLASFLVLLVFLILNE